MKTPRQIELAIQIVMLAFAEKIRIGKPSIPTATHSLRVGLSLIAQGCEIETCLGGFFHDIAEDTAVGEEYIRNLFGDRVHFLMMACTLDPRLEEDGPGENELHARAVSIAEAQDVHPLIIKCADSLDNLRTNSCLKEDWQRSALARGKRWHASAKRFIPEHPVTAELGFVIERENKRLGTATE